MSLFRPGVERFKSVFDNARKCGFNRYESSALAAIAFSPGGVDATSLGKLARIPRSRVYDVVDGLIVCGLVAVTKRSFGRKNRRVLVYQLVPNEGILAWYAGVMDGFRKKYSLLVSAMEAVQK